MKPSLDWSGLESSTIQSSTLQYGAAQCGAVQYSLALYSAVSHTIVWYSTAWYCIVVLEHRQVSHDIAKYLIAIVSYYRVDRNSILEQTRTERSSCTR